jgi:hypothetical protein
LMRSNSCSGLLSTQMELSTTNAVRFTHVKCAKPQGPRGLSPFGAIRTATAAPQNVRTESPLKGRDPTPPRSSLPDPVRTVGPLPSLRAHPPQEGPASRELRNSPTNRPDG